MRKDHVVLLTPEQRAELTALCQTGSSPARALTHARIVLKADQGPQGPAWIDARIAEALGICVRTVTRVRRLWACEGPVAAIQRKLPAVRTPRKLDGAAEAVLVALACSTAPEGRAHWTYRLLANRLVELEIVSGIAPNTVRATLKKTLSNPG